MAEKIFDLPQTRGTFQFAGRVTGTQRDNFYEEKTTKTGKPMRMLNFGVKVDDKSTLYASLTGMVQKSVWFFRSENKDKGISRDSKEIPWKDRNNFSEDGYRMNGVNVGVTKKKNDKGVVVNDNHMMVAYDACEEISQHLKDDESVFIKGNIEFSTYNGKHNVRFTPNQVSLCKNDIDFSVDGYEPNAGFTQMIVFTGIEKDNDNNRFNVSAKIVTYNSIEDAEFVVKDAAFAKMLHKNLKPYTAIKVWGDIEVEQNVDEVESNDVWGQKNKMERVTSPTTRLLVITGADPSTIDEEQYSEDKIDEALAKLAASNQAEKDFGSSGKSSGVWGSVGADNLDDDEEDLPW